MPNQEKAAARKIKPVKAWAIVSPRGKTIGLGFFKDEAWLSAEQDRNSYHIDAPRRIMPTQAELKFNGYRCIRVLISPL